MRFNNDINQRGELPPDCFRIAVLTAAKKAFDGFGRDFKKCDVIDYAFGVAPFADYDRERTIRESFKYVEKYVYYRVLDYITKEKTYRRRVKTSRYIDRKTGKVKPAFLLRLDDLAEDRERERRNAEDYADEQDRRAAALREALETSSPAVLRLVEVMAQGLGLNDAARALGISRHSAGSSLRRLKVDCFKAYLKNLSPDKIAAAYLRIRNTRPEPFRGFLDFVYLKGLKHYPAAKAAGVDYDHARKIAATTEKIVFEELLKNA